MDQHPEAGTMRAAFHAMLEWSQSRFRASIADIRWIRYAREPIATSETRLTQAFAALSSELDGQILQALEVFSCMTRVCALCAAWSWRVAVNIRCQAMAPFVQTYDRIVADRRALAQQERARAQQDRQDRIRAALADWYVDSLQQYHSWQRQVR